MHIPAPTRYDSMTYNRCGRSGLQLPAISLGCWHNFGAPGTDAKAITDEASFHDNCRKMIFTAFDLGITHLDLANNYGPPPGAAEVRTGRIIKELPRDELIVSSKAGYHMWPGPYGEWGSRKYLLASLDQSLKRLDLDYVDIFYSHRPDPNTPFEETLSALDTAVRSGKALYCGISSYSGAQTAEVIRICEAEGFVKPIIHQPSYSALNRWVEPDLLPITRQFGLGVIAFCPLDQGLLTDKYIDGIPVDSRAGSGNGALHKHGITADKIAKVRKLQAIARDRGQSTAQLALAWVLRRGTVTSALIGASRPEQITENVAALKKQDFTDDELRAIDAALA
jgi:L-glyceraldehyde 3-phosphate reductase